MTRRMMTAQRLDGNRAGVARSVLAWLGTWVVLLGLVSSAGTVAAASFENEPADEPTEVLSARLVASHDAIEVGGRAELAVIVSLEGAWHINGSAPEDPDLIPTRFELEPAEGLEVSPAVYPDAERRSFEFSDAPLLVYSGQIAIRLPIQAAATANVGPREIRGTLRYQACNDETCLRPKRLVVSATLPVVALGAPIQASTLAVFGTAAASSPSPEPTEPAAPAATSLADSPPADDVQSAGHWRSWFANHGLLAYAAIFLVGLALNLTPCVYPVIPITLGYFANQSDKREGKTLSLAVVYVLGMALMYSSLGVVAALSGKAFGSMLQSPIVLVFEALVVIALALSMFGLYDIQVPTGLASRLGVAPSGHVGALFMGLTVGIVAAPCLAPAVLGLFLFVADSNSVWLGFSIFFSLALGLGFPFLLLGVASGSLASLPRSGAWMVWIKHLFGFLLLGMALYFLRPLPWVGDEVFRYGIAALAVIGGVFLGFVDRTGDDLRAFAKVRSVIGVALVIAGLVVASGGRGAKDEQADAIQWKSYTDVDFAAALGSGRPLLVDFTAEWCLPCKELEEFTFADDRVKREAARFETFKADGTFENEQVEELQDRFKVRGYPTILFIDSSGVEREPLRVVGFVDADTFLRKLQQVQ